MAGRTYFFWVFAIILLTLGVVYAVDPRALLGLLASIIRLVLALAMFAIVVVAFALLFGPQEQ